MFNDDGWAITGITAEQTSAMAHAQEKFKEAAKNLFDTMIPFGDICLKCNNDGDYRILWKTVEMAYTFDKQICKHCGALKEEASARTLAIQVDRFSPK